MLSENLTKSFSYRLETNEAVRAVWLEVVLRGTSLVKALRESAVFTSTCGKNETAKSDSGIGRRIRF